MCVDVRVTDAFSRALAVVRLHAIERRIAAMESPEPDHVWTAHDHDLYDELAGERAELVAVLISDAPRGGE